ncbi:hypothetical protein BRC67_02430 [Halobacteriales archaeon QH_3_68_24]|nr:MAG: hypothetical protein BRC67_02430 [Halobacteriales archaeon QH_3_68_24]
MTRDGITRRTVLRSAAGVLGGAALAGGAGTVAAQSDGFDGWFDDVSNFDGVVDRRGNDGVVVEVGVDANGGAFGFGPAAVRVSPGTTVRWEWTGEGGGHNVVADDGTFNSGEPDSSADTTFEHTFEETGTYLYVCTPHEAIGMKGAVVVQEGGDSGGGGAVTRPPGTSTGLAVFGGVLFAALAAAPVLGWRADRRLSAGAATAQRVTESAVERPAEEVGHDEFDPTGTLSLVLVYLGILGVMWVFMYFVEFLNNGPTVIG